METVLSSIFKKENVWKEYNHFYASCHLDNILDKVVSLTTNQNAACVVVMILLGPTSSELTFSAFDILAQFVSRTAEIIIRIRSLNISSNIHHLIWYCYLFYHLYAP